jgi:hypothetical protein
MATVASNGGDKEVRAKVLNDSAAHTSSPTGERVVHPHQNLPLTFPQRFFCRREIPSPTFAKQIAASHKA